MISSFSPNCMYARVSSLAAPDCVDRYWHSVHSMPRCDVLIVGAPPGCFIMLTLCVCPKVPRVGSDRRLTKLCQ